MSSHMRRRIHVKSYAEEDTCQVICGGGYMSSHMRRRIHVKSYAEEDTLDHFDSVGGHVKDEDT
jgi:hypothetical protein